MNRGSRGASRNTDTYARENCVGRKSEASVDMPNDRLPASCMPMTSVVPAWANVVVLRFELLSDQSRPSPVQSHSMRILRTLLG